MLLGSLSIALGLAIAAGPASAPGHNPDLDSKCGPGFQWSRKVVGCVQAKCPAGASRTYTLTCSCGEAWNKPFRTCFDPDRPGFATHCVAKGASCGNEVKPKPKPPSRLTPKQPPREPKRPPPKKPPAKEPPNLEEMEVCVNQDLEAARGVYDAIDGRLAAPDPGTKAAHGRAVQAIKTGRTPPAFRGLVVPATPSTAGGPGSCDLEELTKPEPRIDASARTYLDETLRELDTRFPPAWVQQIPEGHAELFPMVGRAIVDNAPESIKNADECTRAKFVYGLALPILEKRFGMRQIDGSSIVGGCGVFFSTRSLVRFGRLGTPLINGAISAADSLSGRDSGRVYVGNDDILRWTGQGTCGEWAAGLRAVMIGAGIKAEEINSYNPSFFFNNHAATAIECRRNGVVEKRVCDAWFLGHDNQQSNRIYWYGGFEGAMDSKHNCRPLAEWKRDQVASNRSRFHNTDDPVALEDFYTPRDLGLKNLEKDVIRMLPGWALRGRTVAQIKNALRLDQLYPEERDRELALALRRHRALAKDPKQRAHIDRLIRELMG